MVSNFDKRFTCRQCIVVLYIQTVLFFLEAEKSQAFNWNHSAARFRLPIFHICQQLAFILNLIFTAAEHTAYMEKIYFSSIDYWVRNFIFQQLCKIWIQLLQLRITRWISANYWWCFVKQELTLAVKTLNLFLDELINATFLHLLRLTLAIKVISFVSKVLTQLISIILLITFLRNILSHKICNISDFKSFIKTWNNSF